MDRILRHGRYYTWNTREDPFGFDRPDPYYFPTDLLHRLQPGLDKPRQGLYKVPRTLPEDPTIFQVLVNVSHFFPQEVTVKILDGHVIVNARHEEQPDEHGYVTRSFTRRYKIPEDVLYDGVTSSLSQQGVLSIKGPRVNESLAPHKGRVVPVEYEKAPDEGSSKETVVDGNIRSEFASRFRI